jgi:hypothetical protein
MADTTRRDATELEAAQAKSINWLIAGTAVAMLAVPLLTWALATDTAFPDQTLPVELVGGLSSFLIAIALLVLVFRRLGIIDRTQPLGMPPGSIRAIMALILILLFVLLVVFVYFDLARPPNSALRGLSAQQFGQIPVEQIAASSFDAQSGTYTVEKVATRSAASNDIAKQVITTVSTLVVSISAFYFGAQSVEMGRRNPEPDAPPGAHR